MGVSVQGVDVTRALEGFNLHGRGDTGTWYLVISIMFDPYPNNSNSSSESKIYVRRFLDLYISLYSTLRRQERVGCLRDLGMGLSLFPFRSSNCNAKLWMNATFARRRFYATSSSPIASSVTCPSSFTVALSDSHTSFNSPPRGLTCLAMIAWPLGIPSFVYQ
jgi:hypothetical protein